MSILFIFIYLVLLGVVGIYVSRASLDKLSKMKKLLWVLLILSILLPLLLSWQFFFLCLCIFQSISFMLQLRILHILDKEVMPLY